MIYLNWQLLSIFSLDRFVKNALGCLQLAVLFVMSKSVVGKGISFCLQSGERRKAVISSLVKYLGLEAASFIHYEEKVSSVADVYCNNQKWHGSQIHSLVFKAGLYPSHKSYVVYVQVKSPRMHHQPCRLLIISNQQRGAKTIYSWYIQRSH